MFKFTEVTLNCLKQSGWHEDYVFDESVYNSALVDKGYEPNEIVLRFFRQFGNLKLQCPRPSSDDDFATVEIDPLWAISTRRRGWIQVYEERLNQKLCFMGTWDVDIILMMNRDGEIYGTMDDSMWYLGASGEEALDNICTQKAYQFPELNEPE